MHQHGVYACLQNKDESFKQSVGLSLVTVQLTYHKAMHYNEFTSINLIEVFFL